MKKVLALLLVCMFASPAFAEEPEYKINVLAYFSGYYAAEDAHIGSYEANSTRLEFDSRCLTDTQVNAVFTVSENEVEDVVKLCKKYALIFRKYFNQSMKDQNLKITEPTKIVIVGQNTCSIPYGSYHVDLSCSNEGYWTPAIKNKKE